jgi:hypothetical protein
LAIDDCWLGTVGNSINIRQSQSTFSNLSQHSAISKSAIANPQSAISINIRQSQSTFSNLNQHSAISKSAIANPQSAIDR